MFITPLYFSVNANAQEETPEKIKNGKSESDNHWRKADYPVFEHQ